MIRARDGGRHVAIKHFVVDNVPCKDRASVRACGLVWTPWDAMKVLLDEPQGQADPLEPRWAMPAPRPDRMAAWCTTTQQARHASFCSTAGATKASKARDLAVQSCPQEGEAMFMRNGVGKADDPRGATPNQCE